MHSLPLCFAFTAAVGFILHSIFTVSATSELVFYIVFNSSSDTEISMPLKCIIGYKYRENPSYKCSSQKTEAVFFVSCYGKIRALWQNGGGAAGGSSSVCYCYC